MKIFKATLVLFLFVCGFAYAEELEKVSPPVVAIDINPCDVSVRECVDKYGELYKVSTSTINAVISCESRFNESAVGDNGHSLGLVQIHMPSWPSISPKEAYNREFAIKFLVKNISAGNGRIWTCYRNIVSLRLDMK